jgi:hypothetical protein
LEFLARGAQQQAERERAGQGEAKDRDVAMRMHGPTIAEESGVWQTTGAGAATEGFEADFIYGALELRDERGRKGRVRSQPAASFPGSACEGRAARFYAADLPTRAEILAANRDP